MTLYLFIVTYANSHTVPMPLSESSFHLTSSHTCTQVPRSVHSVASQSLLPRSILFAPVCTLLSCCGTSLISIVENTTSDYRTPSLRQPMLSSFSLSFPLLLRIHSGIHYCYCQDVWLEKRVAHQRRVIGSQTAT